MLQIMIPAFIVIIIAGIWFLKNQDGDIDQIVSDMSQELIDTSQEYVNPDFILNVTKKIDLGKLKSYGLPIIIDFGANDCIPCKRMAPVLKKLNKELQGRAIILFVDVWKDSSLAQGFPVSSIPTQIFINADGEPYAPENPKTMGLKYITSGGEHTFTTHVGGLTEEQMTAMLYDMGMK
ncbi:MAG: thioredoxin [Firmicutes bacterium HGW-Firmicutes-21]|nr:MAG: thioredoxin [Firmicutes bacterium HGW-Firmicutes-21]